MLRAAPVLGTKQEGRRSLPCRALRPRRHRGRAVGELQRPGPETHSGPVSCRKDSHRALPPVRPRNHHSLVRFLHGAHPIPVLARLSKKKEPILTHKAFRSRGNLQAISRPRPLPPAPRGPHAESASPTGARNERLIRARWLPSLSEPLKWGVHH